MPSSRWIAVAAFVLILGSARLAFSAREDSSDSAAEDAKVETVEGHGPTAVKARRVALENAEKRVEALLEQHFAGRNWEIGQHPLDDVTLRQTGVLKEVGTPAPSPAVVFNDQPTFVAKYRVELTEEYLDTVAKHVRHERVWERQRLLARILAGVVVLLLVTAGYLRLDDASGGYCTRMLRLGALAIVAVAGLVLALTL